MKNVLCPKCGIRMDFMAEAEVSGNSKKIKYFYRCPACGTKISEYEIAIERKDGSLTIKVLQ
ncbi:MAG: hypothetical protein K1T65_04745 [Candidatus Aramenus sp.]|nr:hypothetical protein [Candidatus Aramenus sp.]